MNKMVLQAVGIFHNSNLPIWN